MNGYLVAGESWWKRTGPWCGICAVAALAVGFVLGRGSERPADPEDSGPVRVIMRPIPMPMPSLSRITPEQPFPVAVEEDTLSGRRDGPIATAPPESTKPRGLQPDPAVSHQ